MHFNDWKCFFFILKHKALNLYCECVIKVFSALVKTLVNCAILQQAGSKSRFLKQDY